MRAGSLWRVLDDLLSALVPAVCIACRRAGEVACGDPLCGPCRLALPWLGPRLCPRCGLPDPCGPRCPARAQAFSGAWAPVAYAGAVPALVKGLKERGAVGLARLMAAQIAATARSAGSWTS
jgi:predicted amidophosphoribosyltransferase